MTLTITGTSNGNYTNARIEVSAGWGTGGTTGTLTSFTGSPSCGAGTPSTPTCSEITNRYKLYPINLTNNQAFSYTITFTVDAATAAGTFNGNAQFYTSSNSAVGLSAGPTITVVEPTVDAFALKFTKTSGLTMATLRFLVGNLGPGDIPANELTTVIDPGGLGTFVTVTDSGGATCTLGIQAICTKAGPYAAGGGLSTFEASSRSTCWRWAPTPSRPSPPPRSTTPIPATTPSRTPALCSPD
ncbi:hypothetical protein F4553_000855 [Allocatelliglobosispora scoriae]|uniref:Uncharacterized protein n=1 Tax=Allocatelliglobosispora scoriae TaxID=643052 RepID=A0A841BJU4_9ACTN|nr:hypothetical protein [Allocatelliglobosispora scoriae]MBB5867476.1 hypothetical protein [Allocatelliglobosispora scoriae]